MNYDIDLKIIADKLEIPVHWLKNVIQFESGFNPTIKNKYTGAAGLIQFLSSTAKGMGYKDQIDLITKHPDVQSQLYGPVYNYLKQYKPFPTEQSFYMSIFYPKYRTVDIDTIFPENVRKVNPNIVTVRDYLRKINPSIPPVIVPLALIALVSYFIFK